MNKRVIILGAHGFMGWGLFKHFSGEKKIQVKGLSSRDCNLLSPDSIEHALADLNQNDIVVMAAAVTRLRANNFESMLANIQMVENLCRHLVRNPIDHVVYLSSVDVYGCLEKKFKKKNTFINESFELKPNDYYGTGKVVGELIFKNQVEPQGTAVSILRLPGVFGPGDREESLIARFIKAVTEKGKVTIFGDGQDKRDYLYVDDVHAAAASAIEHRLNDTVNVVSGKSYSICEIVELIKSATYCPCDVEFKKVVTSQEERIKNMQFDNSYLRKVLPELHVHDLSLGISQRLRKPTRFTDKKLVQTA